MIVSFAEGESEAVGLIPVQQARTRGGSRRARAQRKEAAVQLLIVDVLVEGGLKAVIDPNNGQMVMKVRGDC